MTANVPALRSDRNEQGASADLMQLVTFKLVNEVFGVPILDVREIIRMTNITPVPQAPGFVEGVINLRGQILPVVDLRKRFSLETRASDNDTRTVVVEIGDSDIGLIVDSVSEVLRLPADSLAPPPGIVAGSIGGEYIRGIGYHQERMIILLDLKKVFSHEELQTLNSL